MKYFTLLFMILMMIGCIDSESSTCGNDTDCGSNQICHKGKAACIVNPCLNITCNDSGSCEYNTDYDAYCSCNEGYHPAGLSCEKDEVDPCKGVTCSGHGNCVVQNEEAACDCDEENGYFNEGVLKCVNPCNGITCGGEIAGTCMIKNQEPLCVCNTELGYFNMGTINCVNPCSDVDCGYSSVCNGLSATEHQCKCAADYEKQIFGQDEYCIASSITEQCDETGMCEVPEGLFFMGCSGGNCESVPDATPLHAVYLDRYKIGKYEVSVSLYQKCVAAGVCLKSDFKAQNVLSTCTYVQEGSERPMNCITRAGAQRYCNWIGGSLPTEAQWEKAARGIDMRRYPWGNSIETYCDYGIFDSCGMSDLPKDLDRIDGKSPYGIHHMIGNLSEWVSDYYDIDYYKSSPVENPAGPESGDLISRGASYQDYFVPETQFSLYNRYYYPGEDRTRETVGFRCVKNQ